MITLDVLMRTPFMFYNLIFVKLRQGSGKEGQGMAVKAKGLKA